MEKSSNQKIYTDVLIIGGGVIGGASAYYLSKRGLRVIILEKSGIASGSSGSCDGFLFLQSKKDREMISLAKSSLKSFPGLSDELSYDIEYDNCGGLVLFSEHYRHEEVEAFCAGQKESGIDTLIMYRDELRRSEPFISGSITSATYCAGEGQVNPIALNYGFCSSAKKNGAVILTYQSAVSFDISAGGSGTNVKRTITSSGTEIFADEVIVCAGAWSGEVGKMLGIGIPVRPRRGTLIVTEALPGTISHAILDYDYICCKFDENRETGFTVEQTKRGNLLIGSARQFKGFDNSIDSHKVTQILKRAVEIFSLLSEANIIRIFNGFRPYSEDFKPLIGPVEGFSNLWLATGHEGDGIALSCATGKLITGMIESKTLRQDFVNSEFAGINISRFLPSRFSFIKKC